MKTTLPKSPLARWLAREGLTQQEFARRWEFATGFPLNKRVVSKWCVGPTRPNRHSRAVIERATRGAVPSSAWDT